MASSGRPQKEEIKEKFIIEAEYGTTGAFPSATVVLSKVSYSLDKGPLLLPFTNYVHRNGQQSHAEGLLIQQLRDIVEKEEDMGKNGQKVTEIDIQTFQNYAPCDDYVYDAEKKHGCATDIVAFKDDMEKQGKTVKMKITFANFYRWFGEREGRGKQNMEGLGRLRKNDVVLELLQGKTMWQSLFDDNNLVDLTEGDKAELLGKATSKSRIEREKKDSKTFRLYVSGDAAVDESGDAAVDESGDAAVDEITPNLQSMSFAQ